MRRSLIFLVSLLLLPPAAGGQDTTTEAARTRERFELFNACRPMRILISNRSPAAADIGLTSEALQAAAESRLRAARLYSATDPRYTGDVARTGGAVLHVGVGVSDTFFKINVEYMKAVTDEFGELGLPATWVTKDFDSHDGKAGFILSSISQHLDKFLVEYLRVNEAACG